MSPKQKKIIVSKPLDWQSAYLSEAVRSVFFEPDDEGNIKSMPVVMYDPSGTEIKLGSTTTINGLSTGGNYLKASVDRAVDMGVAARISVNTLYGLQTIANQAIYDTAYASQELIRTPTSYKNVETAVAPATTDLWTPAAGKKFRLLGGTICMGGTIAAAAKRKLTLIEETAGTVIVMAGIDIPILGNNIALHFDLRPNGFLASTADKKLQVVTTGATYVTGSDYVSVWGCEEI